MSQDGAIAGMRVTLPENLRASVAEGLAEWQRDNRTERIWRKDPSVWTSGGEEKWLGWLEIAARQRANLDELQAFAGEVRTAGWKRILLIGMGGSSLCPEVLATTFGPQQGWPVLDVLDSTDPSQIRAFESKLDLARALFIVSSKSGSTLEPNILYRYFRTRVEETIGADRAGSRFVAVTDPGSAFEKSAREEGFWRVFHGVPEIGGRYSALSHFGLVPAVAMGLDGRALLSSAEGMAQRCGPDYPANENPGAALGTILGIAARQGRDKLTVFASRSIWDFGAWLEQLVAESTGKQGQGIVPVDLERPGDPAVYGEDRIFVHLRLQGDGDAETESAIARLAAAGHPCVTIELPNKEAIAAEFFRWEFATAVAGAWIGINPFDQPDVEASKVATRALTAAYEEQGGFPPETAIWEEPELRVYADPRNAQALGNGSLEQVLATHLARLGAGDYFCLSAYLEMSQPNLEALQRIRHAVRDRHRVATCLGFGPRFLHSTGQAYKGGPNTGVFLQITCDEAADLAVPGRRATFGAVKAAQAIGDMQVLVERGRRAIRMHLGSDVSAGLRRLERALAAKG